MVMTTTFPHRGDDPRNPGRFSPKHNSDVEPEVADALVDDEDFTDEDEVCRICGEPNDDGEGSDGMCGNCADAHSCYECSDALDERDVDELMALPAEQRLCRECKRDAGQ